jgi:hypothetical protein
MNEMNPNKIQKTAGAWKTTITATGHVTLGLRSPSLDSALRASLRLSKIAPGDFVASLTPTYQTTDIIEASLSVCIRAC